AGFDKYLQYEIVKRGVRIAFSNDVIVYDQKTTTSDQLVKQRARWLNTWFRSYRLASILLLKSIFSSNKNGILFSITLLRPPLFILLSLIFVFILVNILLIPILNLIWFISFFVFISIFKNALKLFSATND